MDTYHAAYWSSDPFRLSSSDEEEDDRDTDVIQPGFEPGSVVMPLALRYSALDRCIHVCVC